MLNTRREFIGKLLFLMAAAPVIGFAACNKRKSKKCATSNDILGPFYREDAPFRTQLNVHNQTGTPLTISGTVYGHDCKTSLHGAVVDIWQADTSAEYDNAGADFNFRGKVSTDANGRYEFSTLVPGRYLNGGSYRPAHIHFRVTAPEHEELITQLYFSGDPHIDTDPWASDEDATERIITLLTDSQGKQTGTFDMRLLPV